MDALIAATDAKLRANGASSVTLLVKGSRFMRMERVVAALTGAPASGSY
jgi:UDP-N-acetylmuramyl pentapeptide synthase